MSPTWYPQVLYIGNGRLVIVIVGHTVQQIVLRVTTTGQDLRHLLFFSAELQGEFMSVV